MFFHYYKRPEEAMYESMYILSAAFIIQEAVYSLPDVPPLHDAHRIKVLK